MSSRKLTDKMKKAELIAVTGGIGTGKSVVSDILRQLGYKVYDCDCEAKRLMDKNCVIKADIQRFIAEDVIVDNRIDRKKLAEIVFNDRAMLETLNRIVHKSVRDDISKWRETYKDCRFLFVETAILYQSNIDLMVDRVWEVIAPDDIRVERVMKRNNLDKAAVLARVRAQNESVPVRKHDNVSEIINDNCMPVLPKVLELLSAL